MDSVLWEFPGAVPSTSTLNNPSVTYSVSGNYSVTLIAYNGGGSDTLVLTNYIEITSATPLPYYEPIGDINQFVLPAGAYATEVNFDGATWNRGWWIDGSSGSGDDFLYYDNYNHDLNGLEERLVFPVFDLSGTVTPKLFFYRSYQQRDAINQDTLVIYVKPCGNNETVVYTKSGSQLANIPGYFSSNGWTPYFPSHWVQDSVDLSPFAGQAVTISFGDIGYGGQILYIDEFRVRETYVTGINEITSSNSLVIFPNPVNNTLQIRSDTEFHSQLKIYDITGRMLLSQDVSGRNASINFSDFSPGLYFIEVNGLVKKFEKRR